MAHTLWQWQIAQRIEPTPFTIVILIKVYASPLITILDGWMQIERREAPKFSMGTVKQVAEAVGAAVAETQDTIGMYDENITSVEVF